MAGKQLIRQGERTRSKMVKFIARYHAKHGYSPTVAEIGDAVGVSSPNAVRRQLLRLQEDGQLTMTPRTARSIRLTEPVA